MSPIDLGEYDVECARILHKVTLVVCQRLLDECTNAIMGDPVRLADEYQFGRDRIGLSRSRLGELEPAPLPSEVRDAIVIVLRLQTGLVPL